MGLLDNVFYAEATDYADKALKTFAETDREYFLKMAELFVSAEIRRRSAG